MRVKEGNTKTCFVRSLVLKKRQSELFSHILQEICKDQKLNQHLAKASAVPFEQDNPSWQGKTNHSCYSILSRLPGWGSC